MPTCSICTVNQTDVMLKPTPSILNSEGEISICHECLDLSKRNFIFLCTGCGESHLRNKLEVIAKYSEKGDRMTEREAIILGGLIALKDDPESNQTIIEINGCISCPDDEKEGGNA